MPIPPPPAGFEVEGGPPPPPAGFVIEDPGAAPPAPGLFGRLGRGAAEAAAGVGRGLYGTVAAPFRLLGAAGQAAADLARDPLGTLAGAPRGAMRAANEMAYGLARPFVMPLTEGKWPSVGEATEYLTSIAAPGLLGAQAPRIAEFARKAPGRYLSLPAERMAAGAEMMREIPGRFGVDEAAVSRGYDLAERLSVRSMTQAPMMALRRRLADMQAQLQMTPLTALRDRPLLKQIGETLNELGQRQNTMTPRQVNATIKMINDNIGATKGAERGLWKQLLAGAHEDMRTAAQATGDPAFMAYERAIHQARLNFLKEDLAEVIERAGVVQQRTGKSMITNPGKIVQWMQTHPEWVQGVESAQPGLLASIQRDLQEIMPVTDIVGRSIPGQRYGSGRLVLGGAFGHLFSRALGLTPGTAESLGAIIGGLSPAMGIELGPAYIRQAFKPVTAGRSPGLGAAAITLTPRERGNLPPWAQNLPPLDQIGAQ